MEMAAPWKERKSTSSFPSLSTAPLGISQKARDFHIPTAWHRPGWKSGKPKSGFPLSHAGLATTTSVSVYSEPKYKKGIRPLRGPLPTAFQDHAVLETKPGFRIILGLENAAISASSPKARDSRDSWRGAKAKVKTFLIGKAKQPKVGDLRASRWSAPSEYKIKSERSPGARSPRSPSSRLILR